MKNKKYNNTAVLAVLGVLRDAEKKKYNDNAVLGQIASMATARFRPPKTEVGEISLLSETVPTNTKYNTKWAVNVFTAWQNTRMNKKGQLETSGGNRLESTNDKELSVPLEHMSAESLNFWLCKFTSEVAKQTGNATLLRCCTYLFAALIAIWENVQGEKAFNILEKSDRR